MEKKRLILFGSGGQAKIVLDLIEQSKSHNLMGFIDFKDYNKNFEKKCPYLGRIENIDQIFRKIDIQKCEGIIAIGSNISRSKVAKAINLRINNFKFANLIHPSCIVSSSISFGEGNLILAGSVICADTIIKNHVSINTGSHIDHDNFFENFSSTGPGVYTGGNVEIGERSFLGIGSSIKHKIKIGNDTVIGANSFVNKNCENNSLYFGVPAKKIREREPDEEYL